MDDKAGAGHPPEIDLFALLDDELGARERSELEAHLGHCPACRARLQACRALVARIDSLPELELTEDLSPKVMRRMAGRGRLSFGTLLLAGMQLAAALSVLWWFRERILGLAGPLSEWSWPAIWSAIRLAFVSLAADLAASTAVIDPVTPMEAALRSLPELSLPVNGALLLGLAVLVGVLGNGLALAQERRGR